MKEHPAGGRCCDPLGGKCRLRGEPAPHFSSGWYGTGDNKHCRSCKGKLERAGPGEGLKSPTQVAMATGVNVISPPWEELNSSLFVTPKVLGIRCACHCFSFCA